MSKREKVLPTWKELKEDLKGMTFAEKADHLWTYYKIYLVGVLFLALIVIMGVSAYRNANKEIVVSGMIVNVQMTQEGYKYLTEDYAADLGCVEGKQTVELLASNFTSLSDPSSSEDNTTAAQKLILQVATGTMDYALVDDIAINFYASQEVFSDLRDIFPADMIAAFEQNDMLYYSLVVPDDVDIDNYVVDVETAERVPIGVRVQSLAFIQDTVTMSGENIYFCVTSHEPDVQKILQIWDRLLAWETK